MKTVVQTILCMAVVLGIVENDAHAGRTVASDITAVSVYAGDALVTREATAKTEAGISRLILETDAAQIVGNSESAAVYGDGELLGVRVVRVPLAEAPLETIRELESKLESLKAEKQAVADAKEALGRQEAFLDRLIEGFGGDAADGKIRMPDRQEVESFLSFFDRSFNAIFERRRKADADMAVLQRNIGQVERELAMYRQDREKTRTGIEVLFNSQREQDIRLEASYRVGRTGWSPVYRASVDGGLSGVGLDMMAAITQMTGEDWNEVTLTVSNAVPVRRGRLPELSPWLLDYRPPEISRRGAAEKIRSMDMALSAEAPMAEADMRETALSFEYTMPAPVTVASRDQETRLPLFSRSIEGDFYHYVAPVLSPEVYLVCEAEADRELLPGPVEVFFENRFTGRMTLGQTGPGERFVLGLGIDPGVQVKREKTGDKKTETAFFGRVERDSIIRELSYRIAAENRKNREILLQVSDRIPVSKTDRIEVKDVSFSPAPERRDVDGKAGVMQWDIPLTSGGTSDITVDFTVSYPKDMPEPVF